MIKTAVIGASGYVGKYLIDSYRSTFSDVVGTSFSTPGENLSFFDITKPDLASLRLQETGHEAILIASANPNIAFCKENQKEAYAINVEGTLKTIEQAIDLDLFTIFLSSDYVFEGNAGPYDDLDETKPTTEYGRQKQEVEKQLALMTDNHLVIRLSKIFGIKKEDKTLIDDMAKSLFESRVINAAKDQIFCPTLATDLVKGILLAQEKKLKGTMNICNPEAYSRFEIALKLAEAMKVDKALVKPINLHSIPQMADRPLTTAMRCSRLLQETPMVFTKLEDCIKAVAANWQA